MKTFREWLKEGDLSLNESKVDLDEDDYDDLKIFATKLSKAKITIS